MWEQWDTIVFPKEIEHGAQDVGWPGIVSQFQTIANGSGNTMAIDPETKS